MSSPTLKVVLYEGEGTAAWEPGLRLDVVGRCLQAGLRVARVTCLCRIRAAEGEKLLLLGCFQPETRDQLDAASSESLSARDVTGMDADEIMEQVGQARWPQAPAAAAKWVPWFPVLDAEKCIHCAKCLTFCLFGVFSRDAEGKVHVAHPAKCKTNCPACGRVCPSGAIVFPKYAQAPINGGASDEPTQPVQVDLDQLAQRDVYAALRNRSGATKEGAPGDQACDCLRRLSEQLDIPADVLAGLGGSPSARKEDA
jgi:Pyruvate/2-oxoacid:ferredoxin oxidoreductase delta subunit